MSDEPRWAGIPDLRQNMVPQANQTGRKYSLTAKLGIWNEPYWAETKPNPAYHHRHAQFGMNCVGLKPLAEGNT